MRGAVARSSGSSLPWVRGAAIGPLPATDATLLHNSNKVALRLTPCDTFARVAETGDTRWGAFEVFPQSVGQMDALLATGKN